MHAILLDIQGSWRAVADAARTTYNKPPGTKEPSSVWKRKILHAEHSPIRLLTLRWKWIDLPYNEYYFKKHGEIKIITPCRHETRWARYLFKDSICTYCIALPSMC